MGRENKITGSLFCQFRRSKNNLFILRCAKFSKDDPFPRVRVTLSCLFNPTSTLNVTDFEQVAPVEPQGTLRTVTSKDFTAL